MASVNLRAHFDGQQIVLDEPFPLQPSAKLLIIVLRDVEGDREGWDRFALENLERAYGPDEPDYSLDLIKDANPEYEGR